MRAINSSLLGSAIPIPSGQIFWMAFAFYGEEIGPAGAHIASHVLHDDGDGVGLGVERAKQRLVGALDHGAFSKFFVIAKKLEGILEVGIGAWVGRRDILAL